MWQCLARGVELWQGDDQNRLHPARLRLPEVLEGPVRRSTRSSSLDAANLIDSTPLVQRLGRS